MLGVAADVKTTIGEGDECERGQLTNFGASRVVSISISLNAPVSALERSMIFSPRIISPLTLQLLLFAMNDAK